MEFRDNLIICKCGRIHIISHDVIKAALEQKKEILYICGKCGNTYIVGGYESTDLNTGDVTYTMHANDFRGKTITPEISKGIYQIIHERGYAVPMLTGMYATNYFNGVFSDQWYPYFDKVMSHYGGDKDDIINFINRYRRLHTTVDMDRFIRETPEKVLEQLSRTSIPGLNWECTTYESIVDKGAFI